MDQRYKSFTLLQMALALTGARPSPFDRALLGMSTSRASSRYLHFAGVAFNVRISCDYSDNHVLILQHMMNPLEDRP